MDNRLLLLLNSAGAWEIDKLTILSGWSEQLDVKRTIWEESFCLAKKWVDNYWDFSLSLEENCLALGVKKIRTFEFSEKLLYNARALYDPNTHEIAINEEKMDEIKDIQERAGLYVFSPQQIEDMLISHELFHHIEETKEKELNLIIQQKNEIEIPFAIRDVGAQHFTTLCLKLARPCQWIDLLWMAEKTPNLIISET